MVNCPGRGKGEDVRKYLPQWIMYMESPPMDGGVIQEQFAMWRSLSRSSRSTMLVLTGVGGAEGGGDFQGLVPHPARYGLEEDPETETTTSLT